ncbi:OLC1v1013891C1 [Oldenlandia corymbosa var. corymbosa]|uniref:OLC1v1013891C1 n=1 Tax=Oldenlandia corymbosa var. corymbosa TaxID=529605 RepID=A0AAV1E096_OLDCO|nr:OLC1v1013891C1 [Oldenlandia corymbosa var. corymbosa]
MKKNNFKNSNGGKDDDAEKEKTEYDYCKICRLNHNQGRRHNFFPNHKKALSSFLSRFQSKLKNDVVVHLKSPTPVGPGNQLNRDDNRLWCVFCDCDVVKSDGSFTCGNAIEHLASVEHLKQLKGFLWKYGGGMDRVDSFRISESDFAKWQKKCKLLKTEAANEGSRGSSAGHANDIQTQMKSDCVERFKNKNSLYSLNCGNKSPNGVLPLQNHTNERSQVLHPDMSTVTVCGPQGHHACMTTGGVVGPSAPMSFSGSFGDLHGNFPKKEHQTDRAPVIGSMHPYGRIASGDTNSQHSSTVSASAQPDSGGNVHTGAPPPWLSASESIQLDDKSNSGFPHHDVKIAKSSKLNPKRVGAAWAERRKIELELQKRGALVNSSTDANWLPNFGRVWQSGSRKESRKEFMGEISHKVDDQMDNVNQLQPYVSKRMASLPMAGGRESGLELTGENEISCKLEDHLETASQLQPYVSKRMASLPLASGKESGLELMGENEISRKLDDHLKNASQIQPYVSKRMLKQREPEEKIFCCSCVGSLLRKTTLSKGGKRKGKKKKGRKTQYRLQVFNPTRKEKPPRKKVGRVSERRPVMSLSAAVQNTLFKQKHGGGLLSGSASTAVIKHRFISFLIWQSILSTFLLFFTKSLLLLPFSCKSPSIFLSFLAFLSFHASLIFFSTFLFLVSSPQPHKPASPLDLLLRLARLVFLPTTSSNFSAEEWRSMTLSLTFSLFVAASALSASVSLSSMCWTCGVFGQTRPWSVLGETLGFRGFLVGLFYGVLYVYKQRWVLQFPIIQYPLFFSFKMGLPSAVVRALKLSAAGYVFSLSVVFFLHDEHEGKLTLGNHVVQQIIFYFGSFVVFLCFELSHHLHQVLHTKRYTFAPPKGSAAAETNPSEFLLSALEESTPKSLLQYLAYLDLCMVCEKNVDTWRRAAFFEETTETYKRVITVCLRPVEQLSLKLSESLESSSIQKSTQLSHQLHSPSDKLADSRVREVLNDFQLCAWCARIVASLTAISRKEDRFGVAQLSGSNAAVISTLLSALLSVETLLGKKTNLQSTNLIGAAGIKWAPMGTGSRDSAGGLSEKRRGSPMYIKAYAMADILRTSLYSIVSAFHDEMLDSVKVGNLEKDWISSNKVLYGTGELLSQKLRLFLDFRA